MTQLQMLLVIDWLSFLLVGSENYSSHNSLFGFLVLAATIANCSLFNIATIILRPDKYDSSFAGCSGRNLNLINGWHLYKHQFFVESKLHYMMGFFQKARIKNTFMYCKFFLFRPTAFWQKPCPICLSWLQWRQKLQHHSFSQT